MLVAFDTNVVVRLLAGDDQVQTARAEKLFVIHAKGDGVFISLVVLAEVSWVLSAAYGWDRKVIHSRLLQLIHTRGVILEEFELVEHALESYSTGKADFADYLILFGAKANSATLFTFDKKLSRIEGASLA